MLTYWLIKRLDPQWKLAHKMWTLRIALLQAVLAGLWMAIPAFQDYMPPVPFAAACVGLALAMAIARLYKKPEAEHGIG